MDDVFYLSQRNISTDEIRKTAVELYGHEIKISNTFDNLFICYKNNIDTHWYLMDISEFKEPVDSNIIKINKISTIYCIAHHTKNISVILPHIKYIMKKYEGWLGNDSDEFQPWFDLHNIELFRYE